MLGMIKTAVLNLSKGNNQSFVSRLNYNIRIGCTYSLAPFVLIIDFLCCFQFCL